jgi:Tfp pilus assembly protein PilO
MRIDLKAWRWWRVDAAFLAGCALFTLLAYMAGIQPVLAAKEEAAQQREQLTAKREQAAQMATAVNTLQASLQTVTCSLANSKVKLQPAQQINLRLSKLTDLAGVCGLKIEDIQPGKTVTGLRFDMVPIRLIGSGNYRTCTQFLHQLRETFPDTAVAAWQISSNPQDSSSAALFRMDLLWHALPAKE